MRFKEITDELLEEWLDELTATDRLNREIERLRNEKLKNGNKISTHNIGHNGSRFICITDQSQKVMTIEEFAKHLEKKKTKEDTKENTKEDTMKLTIDFNYEDIKSLRKKLCNYELSDLEVIEEATKEAFRAYMQ